MLGRLTDSTDAEVCGIALALDMALQYYAYTTQEPTSDGDRFHVFTECKSAIDIVHNRYRVDRCVHVLAGLRSHLRTL